MKIFKLLLLALFARCALQNVHAAVPESRYVSNSASGALPPPPPTPIASSESTTAASPVEAETAEGESGILGVLNNCPAPQGGIIAGAGLYIMQARFDNNLAFGVQGTSNRSNGAIPPGSPGTRVAERIDIDHNTVAAPQIWLGYLSEDGWGARIRYWYFREGTNQSINGSSGPVSSTAIYSAAPLGLSLINGTSSMVATSKLQLQVFDIEGLFKVSAANWNILFSGGVRVARIDQAYNAYVPQNGNNALISSNVFSGAGPTLAVELRHPIFKSAFNVYGSARYSLVFGDGQQQASIPDQNVFAQDQRHIGIGIAEMELGLEYRQTVGRSQLFGQVAAVGQNWNGTGSASRSSVNVLPGGAFAGAAYSGESDINFFGLVVRMGVNY